MWLTLAILATLGISTFLFMRMEQLLVRTLPSILELASRHVAVKERLVVLSEEQVNNSGAKAPPQADPMPQYLWMQAMSESEKWAREEKLRFYREQYEETGDWSKVLQAVSGGS